MSIELNETLLSPDEVETLCRGWNRDLLASNAERSQQNRPSALLVWSCGLFVVTFITLSAIVGIGLMRIMQKSTYSRFITFFVAVGVGSLSGSAVFHLLPQAYGLVDEFDSTSGEKFLPQALTAVCGIYMFFIADKLLKLVLETRKKNKHHAHEHGAIGNGLLDSNKPSPTEEIAMALMPSAAEASIQQQAHSLCVHDHDMQYKAGDSVIGTVAWMIIFGDGLHNFIDGVSIGASFSESILSGINVSVAVICEEFPHELGDVAILVSAGMSLRQALVYNLLSALTCYVGFAIGALFGNLSGHFAPFIFAFAGGMFLYISISCMIPEMKKAMEEGLQVSLRNGLEVFFLQTTGIITGLSLMYVMARFGGQISLGQ
uniref:Zinc transporter ZIP8 n=1 Tax=Panagrellus redivivus TaxID=6233 RepID=A0A7E4VMD8_PANRE